MKRKSLQYFSIAVALLLCLIVHYSLTLPDGRLHVYFLDVGQGDASLIRTPSNKFILVDGGPDDSILQRLGETMPFYARTFDLVILTHPHPDHVNGLVEVLKRYDVRRVLITGLSYDYSGYTEFLEMLRSKKIPVDFANSDSDYFFGEVTLDTIYPFESLQGQRMENANNSSIVFRLIYGESGFYFSGDAEVQEEEIIVGSKQEIESDVLKVGHHGSRTASSESIITLIRPQYAVISAGINNKFKHPHPETINILQKEKARILRTDLSGTVEFISDGKNLLTK
jgi:competence protein ComEC